MVLPQPQWPQYLETNLRNISRTDPLLEVPGFAVTPADIPLRLPYPGGWEMWCGDRPFTDLRM